MNQIFRIRKGLINYRILSLPTSINRTYRIIPSFQYHATNILQDDKSKPDELKNLLNNLRSTNNETPSTTDSKEANINADTDADTNKGNESTDNSNSNETDSKKEDLGNETGQYHQPYKSNDDLFPSVFRGIRLGFDVIVENAVLGYDEMMGRRKVSMLKKKVVQADSFKKPKAEDFDIDESEYEDEVERNTQANAIVLVKEPKSAWEEMKDRIQESKLIREILRRGKKISQAAAETPIGKQAQEVTKNVKDRVDGILDFWETSQNPIVVSAATTWDNITGETEEGMVISEIRKWDKEFDKEEWAAQVKVEVAPIIISAHLKGDLKPLKTWLTEGVYNKLAADIRERKRSKLEFDTNILELDENMIVMKQLDTGAPVIVVVYMVQQINCIRKNGEIIEGSETDIRASFYSIAYQQRYNEDTELVEWKVIDYELAGKIPYI